MRRYAAVSSFERATRSALLALLCAGCAAAQPGAGAPQPVASPASAGSTAQASGSTAQAASGAAQANGSPAQPGGSTMRPGAVASCSAAQVRLRLDGRQGEFDGMSHSGTALMLTNEGAAACRLAPFPEITFVGHDGPLSVAFTAPGARGMHPGPVVLPITLAPGGVVQATLRWIDGAVFDDSVCLHPTQLSLRLGASQRSVPLQATLCGARPGTAPDGQPAGVSVERSRWLPPSAQP